MELPLPIRLVRRLVRELEDKERLLMLAVGWWNCDRWDGRRSGRSEYDSRAVDPNFTTACTSFTDSTAYFGEIADIVQFACCGIRLPEGHGAGTFI
jgi:hypothetical protein